MREGWSQVRQRIQVLESAASDSGSEKLKELEMRMTRLEDGRLAQKKVSASSYSTEVQDGTRGVMTSRSHAPDEIGQTKQQQPEVDQNVSGKRDAEPAEPSRNATGRAGESHTRSSCNANSISMEAVLHKSLSAANTMEDKKDTPIVCQPHDNSAPTQTVAEVEIRNGLDSLGKLQKQISGLEKHYARITGDMQVLQQGTQQVQAHCRDLSDRQGALLDGVSKLQQQINADTAISVERQGKSQQQLLELEGSQKQVLAAAAESQKAVLALTRRVAAVEMTHMNAERAATVAAAEARELWRRIATLEQSVESNGVSQEMPGSQLRSKSIDSALSYHGAKQDSFVPSFSPTMVRSPDARSRAGAPRSFLNWPWRP